MGYISKEYIIEAYDPPFNEIEVKTNYGMTIYKKLKSDPAHRFRMETGIELIHKEPTKQEQLRIHENWKRMTRRQKRISDAKSDELFGMSNEEHHILIMKKYWS